MAEHLIFMMGEFSAEFPTDRQYAYNHMWGMSQDDGVIRFGFTAYAVRLLQDVYFLDWLVDAPATVAEKQEIGSIESKKAESALFAPASGQLVRFNQELMADPSTINLDKYAGGWLFEIAPERLHLMTPAQYLSHLGSVWEKTQQTIKGQLNM